MPVSIQIWLFYISVTLGCFTLQLSLDFFAIIAAFTENSVLVVKSSKSIYYIQPKVKSISRLFFWAFGPKLNEKRTQNFANNSIFFLNSTKKAWKLRFPQILAKLSSKMRTLISWRQPLCPKTVVRHLFGKVLESFWDHHSWKLNVIMKTQWNFPRELNFSPRQNSTKIPKLNFWIYF